MTSRISRVGKNHGNDEYIRPKEKLKSKNVLRSAVDEEAGEEDALLTSDSTDKPHIYERDEGVTRQGAKNMAISLLVTSLAMIGHSMFSDAYYQWLYVEFEKIVLGANVSLLNSTTSDPCIKDSNSTSQWAKELDRAQTLTSNFSIYAMIVSLIPAFFVNMVLGVYTDSMGRRILFLAPMLGYFIRMAVGFAVGFWELNVYWHLLGIAIFGLSGHLPALFMGIYVYTADNTGHKKSRSFGMVIAQTILNVCYSLTHLADGYFINDEGYVWPMFTGSVIMACALVICFFFMEETLDKNKMVAKKTFLEGLKGVFSFYVMPCENPKYRRKDFSLLGLVFFLYSSVIGISIQSMFLMNEPLCWSSIKIGDVTTFQGLLSAFASLVLMKGLQRFMSDEAICILSLFSAAGSRYVLAFAVHDWMIYLAYTVGMFELLLLPVIRAILSRMVPLPNRGSLFASVAVIEVATFVIAGSGFDAMYSYTVSFWHGLTYFAVASCVMVASAFMMIFTVAVRRRQGHVTTIVIEPVQPIND